MTLLPARKAAAFPMHKGHHLKLTNTHGKQVIDFWAFHPTNNHDYLSMGHSRTILTSISPRVGDSLYSNHRKPMLTLVEDTTPGVHDMLWAACDQARYRMLGAAGYHDNCHDNMHQALRANFPLDEYPNLQISDDWIPDPLNLFMNVAVDHRGGLEIRPPTSERGQYVVLRAEMDLVIVMSSCPQDMVPVNGGGPADCEYEIFTDAALA
ncbi:hypothetical protein F5B19DRAFT_449062 [Rostrohypoxylon terebratum]|nr:hypothetical protein F5B19DRAFT_449062 [Rostrohypoxylon terebratum]